MLFEFPQYRKLSNEKSYYEILSLQRMREIQRLGENWTEHTLEAKILPERNLIHDLLSGQNGYYLEITHDEFEAFERHCQNKLKRY